jgi:hypothetical protein
MSGLMASFKIILPGSFQPECVFAAMALSAGIAFVFVKGSFQALMNEKPFSRLPDEGSAGGPKKPAARPPVH